MSRIKLTNSVTVDSSSLSAFPDYSNKLADVTIQNAENWTANYDCFVFWVSSSNHAGFSFGGMQPGGNSSDQDTRIRGAFYFVRKGQIITVGKYGTSNGSLQFQAYGTR